MKSMNVNGYNFSVIKNDGFGDYAQFLYLLVKNCKLRNIVEIGVDRGFSTKMLLKAVKETDGLLYSIDIEDKSDLFSDGDWEFIQDDSSKLNWAAGIIDLLFVDGDHSYKGCLGDLENFYPHVKKNGFVVVHDTQMPDVRKAFDKFFKDKRVERIEFPFSTSAFAVVRKL